MSLARWVNVAAGAWIFVCAWVLPAPPWQRLTLALLGMAVFLIAFVAMAYVRLRWVNTLLALWAVLSPFALALPATRATVNQLATGLLVLVASLWPGHHDDADRRPLARRGVRRGAGGAPPGATVGNEGPGSEARRRASA